MSDIRPSSATPLRLAEIMAAFSLAVDIGTGVPLETMLRVTLLSLHLGQAHGLTDSQLSTAYYLPLLALTGCTATAW